MAMNKLLKKWYTWVAIIAGLLMIASVTFGFSEKTGSDLEEKETPLVLSGVIWDENRELLSGVTVRLREFALTDVTNQDGEFRFQIKAPEAHSVNLIATKDGYETVDTDAMLGETSFNFKMHRKKKPAEATQPKPMKNEQTKGETKLWKKWYTWVPFIAALLAIPGAIFDLPGKIRSALKKKETNGTVESKPEVQILSGIIWDEGNEPLAGVTVTLPESDQTTTTSQHGKYKFQVTAKKQQTVNLIAQKAGYETYNTYAALGNPAHNFAMERRP